MIRDYRVTKVPHVRTQATLASNTSKWGSHLFLLSPTSPSPQTRVLRFPLPCSKSESESLFSPCTLYLRPWSCINSPARQPPSPPAPVLGRRSARCISAPDPARWFDAPLCVQGQRPPPLHAVWTPLASGSPCVSATATPSINAPASAPVPV